MSKRFQILSLSGGGFLGLYTVTVIAELEKELGHPIARCFDLIAGTSVGGIIALGLSKEIPATEIKSAFERHGPLIFSSRPAPSGALANQNDSWEVSDPKAIYLWFKDAFEDAYRGRVRRLVRYLKAWSALKFPDVVSRPSSILLTVLVVDAVLTLGVDILTADDDAFRSIVSEIADRVAKSQSVLNPVNEAEDLALRLDRSDWRKISEMIAELKEQCDRALDSDDEVSAAYVWQEAFEYLFPVPEAGASVLAEKSNLPAPIFVPEIAVSATSKANRNLTYSGQNKIGPIPKGCDIEFRLANTGSLPFGATVTWTVRNEGREAENKNDLGHRVGAGLVAFETSAYRGTHYMDCTVKVGGKVVAMRRVPVEISGVDAPRRNPVNRPAWTRFRR